MKSGDVLEGKYRLTQPIGEGAMGEVWAGENLSTGERIALKLIIASAKKNNLMDVRQRMVREARTCAKLQHPSIVRMLDVGETPDGDPFLVLELLRGRTLAERLKDTRRIEPNVAARIGAEIATALAVAHAAKIIHRDLKPANIFLHQEEGVPDEHFVVKVLDFGVSKHLDGHAEGPVTMTNVAVGSPVYMSPEQVALQKDLDGRTDLWSLGIVLYEMLTGGRPFTGNVGAVVRAIMFTRMQKVAAPSTKVRDVSPEFDAIVLRCLEGDRDKRYSDASEVAKVLWEVARQGSSKRIPTNPHPSAVVAGLPAPTSTTPLPLAPEPRPGYTRLGTEKMPDGGSLRDFASAATPKCGTDELRGPGGTHLMPTNQATTPPVPPTLPVWRNEMEQWRARRVVEAAAISASEASVSAPNHRDVTGTTSEVGALSKSGLESVPMEPSLVRRTKRRRSAQLLFALMGLSLVAALLLMIVLVRAVTTDHLVTTDNSVAPIATSSPVPSVSFVPPKQLVVAPSSGVGPPAVTTLSDSRVAKSGEGRDQKIPQTAANAVSTSKPTAVKTPQRTPSLATTTCKTNGTTKSCPKTKRAKIRVPWDIDNL